jgi:hypothetical protein
VTLADLMPIRIGLFDRTPRSARKHRAGNGRREHDAWRAAADDYFERLRADRQDTYAAWEYAEQRRQDAETVAACALSDNERLAGELAWWRDKFGPQLADEINANRVDVPPMQRIGADLDTAPTGIDVRTLREAAAAGLLDAVTDPGHVHAEGVA